MVTEGRMVSFQLVSVDSFDCLGHPKVQQLAAWRQQPAVDHLADPIVCEVESISCRPEQMAAHQLLDPPGGIAFA